MECCQCFHVCLKTAPAPFPSPSHRMFYFTFTGSANLEHLWLMKFLPFDLKVTKYVLYKNGPNSALNTKVWKESVSHSDSKLKVIFHLRNIELSLAVFCSQAAFLKYRQMRGGWKESHYSNSFITRQTRQRQHTTNLVEIRRRLFRGFRQRFGHEFWDNSLIVTTIQETRKLPVISTVSPIM